jgi:hypothetical protein
MELLIWVKLSKANSGVESEREIWPLEGLRDVIREKKALTIRACPQNDCEILYGSGFTDPKQHCFMWYKP